MKNRSTSRTQKKLAEMEQEISRLREGEHYYHSIFSKSKVSIWEEDFSRVFEALEELKPVTAEELRQYFDEDPERVFDILSQVEVKNVNPATLEMFEAESKEDLQGSLRRVLPPEAYPFLRDELVSLAMGEALYEGETVNRSLKGKTLYLWVTIITVEETPGSRSILVNIMDISTRHERDLEKASAMERVQAERIFAETMQEITLALHTQTRKQSLLDTILQQLQRITDFSTACILMSLEDSLVIERSYGHRDPFLIDYLSKLSLKIEDYPLIREMIDTRRPKVIKSTEREPGWIQIPHCEYIKSLIQIPIFIANDFYGILSIEHDREDFFTVEDMYRMVPFTQVAAIAIGKVELFERLNRELEEKQRTRQALAASLEQKETLLREIHHRVKNNLSLINSLINLQCSQSGNPELRSTLNKLQGRILSILMVHEKLYRSTDLQHIDLSDYIKELLESLLETVRENHPVSLVNRIEKGITVDNSRIIPLGLVITELFTNTVKYAHPFQGDSLEFTVIGSLKEEEIRILTRDNGPGLPKSFGINTHDSLGLTLIDNLARQLNGKADITDPSQAEFRITFPHHQS